MLCSDWSPVPVPRVPPVEMRGGMVVLWRRFFLLFSASHSSLLFSAAPSEPGRSVWNRGWSCLFSASCSSLARAASVGQTTYVVANEEGASQLAHA